MPIVDVDRLKRSGEKFASGFTPGQKVISVLGAVGLVFAMVMFTRWSTAADYSPLFSNLSGKDAGDITKSLDSMGVKWKLADGGNTVLVPKADVYKARVDLSAKGLPGATDGYALLDHAGITTSQFTQQVDYQRAVQTELGKTIMAIRGVNSATVNLTLPSTDPFVDASAQKAKASVQVDSGSVRLSNEQVMSIVHLVASAVKDLSPDGISVTDTAGNTLYAAGSDGAFTSAQNLSKQLAYQDAIKTQLESLIAKSLGPGHAAVAINAQMDFSTGTTEKTTVTPLVDSKGKQIVLSEDHDKTKYGTTSQCSATGVIAPTNGAAAPQCKTNLNEDKGSSTLGASTQTDKTTSQSPKVTSLTGTVFLDQGSVKAADLPKWQSALASAAGINAARGDKITVATMPMDKATQKLAQTQFNNAASPKAAAAPLDLLGILRYVVTLLIVAIVLFLAWRSVKRGQLSLGPVRVPLDLAALEAGGAANYGNELGGAPAAELPPGARMLEPARSPVEAEVSDLIDRQPEDVAQTLRSWLADRRA